MQTTYQHIDIKDYKDKNSKENLLKYLLNYE